jgi:hypothetical protein
MIRQICERFRILKLVLKNMKYINQWDIADAILHYNFEFLVLFVEYGGLEIVELDGMDHTKESHREFMRIYYWWKNLREKHIERYQQIVDYYYKKYPRRVEKQENGRESIYYNTPKEKVKKIFRLDQWLYEVANKNLRLLIKYRGGYWT